MMTRATSIIRRSWSWVTPVGQSQSCLFERRKVKEGALYISVQGAVFPMLSCVPLWQMPGNISEEQKLGKNLPFGIF